MIQANLVPIPRRMARQRHHRIRLWMSICSAYCVLLVITYGSLQAMWGHGDQLLEHDVSTLTEEIVQADKEMKIVAPKLNEARLTLAASMAVGSQPDWSILLALLAQEMREHDETTASYRRALLDADFVLKERPALAAASDSAFQKENRQIVLSHCELVPITEAAVAPGSEAQALTAAVAQPRFTLALGGIGRSQAAISHYVLRLENTGLFGRVTLIESKLAPFGNGEAVSFRIGCTLGEVSR